MIKTQMVQAIGVLRAMICFLPAFGSGPKKCRHDDILPGSGWKLRHVHGAGKAIRREAHQIPVSCPRTPPFTSFRAKSVLPDLDKNDPGV